MATFITNANIITGPQLIKNGTVKLEGRRITGVFDRADRTLINEMANGCVIDAKGNYVTPGLIDTHIHGMGGYGTEDACKESILGMSKSLAEFGVTSFIPTIYPNGAKDLFKAEKAIVDAMGHEEGARILGVNVEGPFISPKSPGALPKESLSPVDLKYFDKIIKHADGKLICMTVAPELNNIEKLAEKAKKEKVVLLCGHTDATFDQVDNGRKCGINHTTHFFNAMSKLHHREPGVVGAVLINEDMNCEIIADGVHVNKELVKFVIRSKKPEHVVLITDSLKPNHQKEGILRANGVEVVLSDKGAFVSADNPELLNGSALTLNKAIANLKKWGVKPEYTVQMATKSPSLVYKLRGLGEIKEGYKADLCIFDKNFNAMTVFVDGKVVYNNGKIQF